MRTQLPTNTHQHCCFFPPWLSGNFSLVLSIEYKFNHCSYWITFKKMLLLYKFQCCEDFLTSTSQFVCLGKLASLNEEPHSTHKNNRISCTKFAIRTNFAWEKQAAVQPTINMNAACNYNCKVFAPSNASGEHISVYAHAIGWHLFIFLPSLALLPYFPPVYL